MERVVVCGVPTTVDDHACDLARDHIVGDAIFDFGATGLVLAGQEPQKIAVYPDQIGAVLPRVFQSARRDLWELAAASPAGRHERVDV